MQPTPSHEHAPTAHATSSLSPLKTTLAGWPLSLMACRRRSTSTSCWPPGLGPPSAWSRWKLTLCGRCSLGACGARGRRFRGSGS